jgi:hypothetical protein
VVTASPRILVRHRSRLGPWYYVLRPLAIVFAALFWVLRGVLVVLIVIGWWAFWLVEQLFVVLLDGFVWLLYKYARLRQGPAAEEELRRATAESEAAGRAWRARLSARVARRVGWPMDTDDEAGHGSST